MKQRTGKECKKTDCIRHDSYKRWQPGDSNLNVCMQCKWAFVSQLSRKPNAAGEVRRNAVTSTGLLADESKGE